MFKLYEGYNEDEFEDCLKSIEGKVLYKSMSPIWNSLKYYDDENENEWVECWMTERFYAEHSLDAVSEGRYTEALLTDIVNSRLGDSPLRDFKLKFLFAKEALGLTTKELIQVIDLYEKQQREISLAVEASALSEILKLNKEEEQRLADNYDQWKNKKLTKKGWLENHLQIEEEYKEKRRGVIAHYSDIERSQNATIKSFADILLEYRSGQNTIQNDENSFDELNAQVFTLIHTTTNQFFADRKEATNPQCHFIMCMLDNIFDSRKILYNMKSMKNAIKDSCHLRDSQLYWLYREIVMLVEDITSEELDRLYKLFTAMKDNFSGADEGDPYEEWNSGIIDSDEKEERDDLIKQRDKMRLRKLLQKVKDERD